MPRLDYTGKDSAGHQLNKGDTVLITYPAEVTRVWRDGTVTIRMSDGTITAFYPEYMHMERVNPK